MKRIVITLLEPLFNLCYKILMVGAQWTRGRARKPYGSEELKLVHQALRSQRLFRWNGKMTETFEQEFARAYGVPYAIASTSGTAAIHVALGALDLNPGDEVITTPITDIGTIIPILAQNAIPVFADVDDTYTLDPAAIEQRISPRTKAVIVVHVFGNPCDMDSVQAICQRHGLALIEDCSQSHMTEYRGKFVGTIGDVGCFSFQESKHMTTGDGGMTITNSSAYADRMRLFSDKGFDRHATTKVMHQFHAPNYRMNELTAAVGLAQLRKVTDVVRRRNHLGTLLSNLLSDVRGVRPAPVTPGAFHPYWSYPIYLEDTDLSAFLRELQAARISAACHMSTPVYFTADSLRSRKTYGNSGCPFSCVDADHEYGAGLCPNAESLSEHLVNIWINENWKEADIQRAADVIKKCIR